MSDQAIHLSYFPTYKPWYVQCFPTWLYGIFNIMSYIISTPGLSFLYISSFSSDSTSLQNLPFPRLIFRLPPEQGSSITLQKFPQPSQPRSPLSTLANCHSCASSIHSYNVA
ncbi:hypothetical protein FOYG_12236 [Fusarium oxysporum NRRL 32931]|uniref:Uncharacterized protein n=1 Tax=Fusarium oxysporum NRRL 32931 TaxID=660029 RepID=W9HV42_FUSOX|nr:hypothetical protein FOYG_12236 [Fusarium oxysporum NRRL 32931]EWY84866.1 hypothetical protein FOYG_12236 [Fusarium oxysporum NRRL 32931]